MSSLGERPKIGWKPAAFAAVSMMFLSLYPQLHFWTVRGSQWNGSYAAIEGVGDEIAYSAYVNALIAGRPRRNDPYTGRDSQSKDPRQTESLFSIQFVPAYLVALAARALGLSAATAFIILTPLAAGAAALALFWLLAMVTGRESVAATGAIVVLCLGTLVGGHGHWVSFFGHKPLYNYLMFLRRYQPSATFPLFIIFCAIVWRAITSKERSAALLAALAAGLVFALLVFSYVYLWTAAAAWLACLWLVWLIARPPSWRPAAFAVITGVSVAALIPFAVLYSNRAASMDLVQALQVSHRVDLFRLPELIAFVVLVALAYFARRQSINPRDQVVLLSSSFALLPIAVFNQQVITGLSLQPLHYEMFVANYSVLIAIVLAATSILKSAEINVSRRALIWIAIAAFEWGAYETFVATIGSMPLDSNLDDARPVAVRLAELAPCEPRDGRRTQPTVLATDLLVADGLPTTAPQPVLWAPHMLVFSGTTELESKERFYQYLYYTGIGVEQLGRILTTEPQYGFAVGLFGFERTVEGLGLNLDPVTHDELEHELQRYAEYCSSFTRERAEKINLSYLLFPAGNEPDLSNLDHWYERTRGERIGKFVLYRIRLRDRALGPEGNNSETARAKLALSCDLPLVIPDRALSR